MRIRKILTVLLTLAMVVSLLPATAFAANNTATTMRLEKTQGTVTVSNATGKNVTQTANMKLYNGYKVKTGAKSYAWISLDDTKVAKLDANSVMEVQKKGKSLTLYLSSGNMFFNVSEKLQGGENLNIKTSTMTTGIRGTSGCVTALSDRMSEIHLMTGEVQIWVEHPTEGKTKVATLQAGQKAISMIDWEAMEATGEMADIVIELLENHDIHGNCAAEIAADPALMERIEDEAPHLLPKLAAEEAADRLAADEAADEAKQNEINNAAENQDFPEDVDPYFEGEAAGGGGGGGGGAAAPAETVETVSTWAELQQQLSLFTDSQENMTITLTGNIPAENEEIDGNEPLYVADRDDATLTLNLADYALTLPESTSIVNDGNLVVTNANGFIQLVGGGTVFQNNGTMTLKDGTIVLANETDTGIRNTGTLHLSGGDIRSGSLELRPDGGVFTPDIDSVENSLLGTAVKNYGEVNMTAGIIEAASGIINDVQGDAPEAGDPVVNISGGSLTCSGEGISVVNGCTATISGGTFTGSSDNNNFINNIGETKIEGGTFTANGSVPFIMNNGKLTISAGTFYGNGGTGNTIVHNNNDAGFGSEAEISGGTFTLIGENSVALNNTHIMNVTGGTINVNAKDAIGILSGSNVGLGLQGTSTININVAAAATDAVGLWVAGTGAVNTANLKITAYAGTGMQMEEAAVTFGSNTRIFAYGGAKALYQDKENPANLTRPITAIISAEAETETEAKEKVYNAMDTYMSTTTVDSGDGRTSYRLEDSYGQASSGQMLAESIAKFNEGTSDVVITLNSDIDMTDTRNSNLELPNIGAAGDTKTLTLDTNGKTLTLRDTLQNYGRLKVTGSGIITHSEDMTNSNLVNDALIYNDGTMTWAGATMNINDASTSSGIKGIESMGSLEMTSGTINVRDESASNGSNTSGIYVHNDSSGDEISTFTMNGGSINVDIVASAVTNDGVSPTSALSIGTRGTAALQGGTITATTAAGHVQANGVSLSGGTLNMEGTAINSTNSTGIGIYSNSVINLNGGSVVAKDAGAYAIYNGERAEYTGSQTTVKAITQANVLHTVDGTMPAGYAVSDTLEDGYYTLTVAGDSGAVVNEDTLKAAVTAANAQTEGEAVITLGDSFTTAADTVLEVYTNTAVPLKIDLAGKNLTLTEAYNVPAGVRLTITDSSADKNGKLIAPASANALILTARTTDPVGVGATVTLDAGTIESVSSLDAVVNHSLDMGSENVGFFMTGGKIANTNIGGAVDNDGTFIMSGGEIISNRDPAIGNRNARSFTMNGGTITYNGADSAVSNSGIFNMNAGTIDAAGADATAATNNGTFNMTGGTVKAKVATVFAETATLPAGYVVSEKGTDDYYTLVKDDSQGGGAEAVAYEAGDWAGLQTAMTTFSKDTDAPSATITLTGNVSDSGGTALTFSDNSRPITIDLDGKDMELTQALTAANGTNVTIDLNGGNLTMAQEMVVAEGANVTIIDSTAGTAAGIAEGDDTGSADAAPYGKGTISMDGSKTAINNKGTLEMYGGTITTSSAAAVNNEGTFNMYGGQLTTTSPVDAALNNSGTAVLRDGSITATTMGAAVKNNANSSFTMNGGSLKMTGDTSSETYWPSALMNLGTTTLNAGSITATGYSYGIQNGDSSNTNSNTIKTTIDGTDVTANKRVTVYNWAGLDIKSGTIENTGEDYALEARGAVTMSGGTITAAGRSVYTWTGTFDMSGGTITSPYTAFENSGATLTMSGGTIETTGGGSGYAVDNMATFKMNGDGTVIAEGEKAIAAVYNRVQNDSGATVSFNMTAGTIQAYGTATAIQNTDTTQNCNITFSDDVEISAAAEDKVFTPARDAYTATEGTDGRFYLTAATSAASLEEEDFTEPAAEEEETPAEPAAGEEEPTESPAA